MKRLRINKSRFKSKRINEVYQRLKVNHNFKRGYYKAVFTILK